MVDRDQQPHLTLQTLRVLETFLEHPTQELAAGDVRNRANLASGMLYPILLRLETAGWFVSRWEVIAQLQVDGPRRRLYRLTPSGLARASEAFASHRLGVIA